MDNEIYVPQMNPGAVPPPPKEVFAVMGEANIERMLEDFYLELDRGSPELRALFPADMVAASSRSAAFFVGLLGGPPRYHERHGNPMMRARHLPFAIGIQERNQWVACMDQAMGEVGVDPQLRERLRDSFMNTADWMRNKNV